MEITVASWNILHDYWSEKAGYPTQAQRIEAIAIQINSLIQKNEPFVLFLCELELSSVSLIEKATGLKLVGKPAQYERLATLVPRTLAKPYIAFFADPKTAKTASVTHKRTTSKTRDALALFEYEGLRIIGSHVPQRPFTDFFQRREHISEFLRQKADIVMGDFNATPLFPSRWRMLLAKFAEIHKSARPPFPDPFYKGKNIASWWPTMNIDVMYLNYDSKLECIDSGHSLTSASDHPLIWARFKDDN